MKDITNTFIKISKDYPQIFKHSTCDEIIVKDLKHIVRSPYFFAFISDHLGSVMWCYESNTIRHVYEGTKLRVEHNAIENTCKKELKIKKKSCVYSPAVMQLQLFILFGPIRCTEIGAQPTTSTLNDSFKSSIAICWCPKIRNIFAMRIKLVSNRLDIQTIDDGFRNYMCSDQCKIHYK